MNPNESVPKNAAVYVCVLCDFKCFKKSNYTTHLTTMKHQNLTKPNIQTNYLGIDSTEFSVKYLSWT